MNLRKRFVILAGIACHVVTSQAVGAPCEGDSINVPDSATFASVLTLAEVGDTHAQAQMGEAYLRGKGIERDVRKSFSWFEKSAAGGSSEGQHLLGVHLIERAESTNSQGDYMVAADWLRKSADQGCMPSLLYLGVLTKQGNGVQKNIEAGIEMISKAAKEGVIPAQILLGVMLSTGDEIKKDTKAGFNWIKRAADSGDSSAKIFLASAYLEGIGTEKKPELSVNLLMSVISKKDQQSPTAAYSLGWMYMEGRGFPVDKIKALEAMLLAANSHISDSEERVRTLTDDLPKQKMVHSCGVYMDPYFFTNNAKEHLHASEGEMVVVMWHYKKSAGVYFPDRRLVGFILRSCIGQAE